MDDDPKAKPGDADFLSRWSRLKRQAREQPPATQPEVDAKAPPPALPPVDTLTLESDFSGFLHPKVDADLRRAALKKLFSDPHFNVMDGLDTYVDDYSQPNVLPATMAAGLRQAQNILAWARETKEETAARFAEPAAESPVTSTADEVAPAAGANAALAAVDPAADVAPEVTVPLAEGAPTLGVAERKS
jgi:hypothetical protein